MQEQSSIVLELQRLATDKSHDVTDLCRKALLVATKLKLDDLRDWLQKELHGYKPNDEMPRYRHVRCELKLRNPYYGLVPYVFADKRTANAFNNPVLPDSIGVIADLLDHGDTDDTLAVGFGPEQMTFLMECQERTQGFCLEPVRIFGRSQLAGIVDAVRTAVLEWSLRLEAEGILGDGLTFSPAEKERAAAAAPSFSIGSVQTLQANVVGSAVNSPVNQQQSVVVKRNDIASLKKHLRSSGLSVDDVKELVVAIKAEPEPRKAGEYGPKVGAWISKMVDKAASGAWGVGVGAAGSLLAQAIGAYYGWPVG